MILFPSHLPRSDTPRGGAEFGSKTIKEAGGGAPLGGADGRRGHVASCAQPLGNRRLILGPVGRGQGSGLGPCKNPAGKYGHGCRVRVELEAECDGSVCGLGPRIWDFGIW